MAMRSHTSYQYCLVGTFVRAFMRAPENDTTTNMLFKQSEVIFESREKRPVCPESFLPLHFIEVYGIDFQVNHSVDRIGCLASC